MVVPRRTAVIRSRTPVASSKAVHDPEAKMPDADDSPSATASATKLIIGAERKDDLKNRFQALVRPTWIAVVIRVVRVIAAIKGMIPVPSQTDIWLCNSGNKPMPVVAQLKSWKIFAAMLSMAASPFRCARSRTCIKDHNSGCRVYFESLRYRLSPGSGRSVRPHLIAEDHLQPAVDQAG